MKKLLLISISFALFTGKGIAQSPYSFSKKELKQEMALNAPEIYQKYQSGSTLKGVGMGLTLGGLVTMVIGIAAADKETVEEKHQTTLYLSGPGARVAIAGTICALAGTPLWIIGGSKKRIARNRFLRDYTYNIPPKTSPYLQLNAARNGVGLAYVF
jgi:hypothetical protein